MLLESETIAQAREAERSVQEAYDLVPYPSSSQHRTDPDHLAALAILHGLDPAPPERCRVLELGCADGGNLIPMAVELPGSRFVGIDLSPRQIGAGRAFASELGLDNLELRAESILDLDASMPQESNNRQQRGLKGRENPPPLLLPYRALRWVGCLPRASACGRQPWASLCRPFGPGLFRSDRFICSGGREPV